MLWLSSISVRAKLALLFCITAVGLAIVTLVSLAGMRQTAAETRALVDTDFGAVRQLGEVRAAIGNMRRFEKDMFLNMSEEADLDRYHADWRKVTAGGQQLAQALAPQLEDSERAAVVRMQAGLDAYRQGVESIVQGIRTGKVNDPWAANKAMEPLKGDVRAADKAFGDIVASVMQRVGRRQAELARLADATLALTLATAGGVLVLAGLMAWVIGQRIVQPLREAVKAVQRVADGNLAVPLAPQGSDEVAQVVAGVQRMQEALRGMVGRLRGGIEQVATASTQVAQGSADMSRRTEQQAASLQQSAASMEQITATMGHSSQSTSEAHALARAASDVAQRGGTAVAEVMTTMGQIEQASRRIADIIGVIDGIAFQTNILALNAAVEAARAGEQGRGFAVVATEVRTLAGRSAEAARQIKTLVADSVAQVASGNALVAAAGGTMNDIVTRVRSVSEQLDQITAAAQQQTEGLRQVGSAVGELDRHTQQSSSLLEQSAAAAASLQRQAGELADAVKGFRLAREEPAPMAG